MFSEKNLLQDLTQNQYFFKGITRSQAYSCNFRVSRQFNLARFRHTKQTCQNLLADTFYKSHNRNRPQKPAPKAATCNKKKHFMHKLNR